MKIIFAGTPELSIPSLEALLKSSHQIIAVYTQPDRPAGRGQKLQASPVKIFAQSHQLPLYQPQTLKDPAAQQELINLKADIIVVIAYGLLLPKAILDAPRFGCINIHVSLLPRWRGAAPIQRAILAGDRETGVTIMQMDQGLDTGQILLKKYCPISATDTSKNIHDRLAILGAEALIETLPLIENHQLQPQIQEDKDACYAPKLSKEEANINWQQSAIEIDRAIRAFNPYPIAYSFIDGQLVRIWQATPIQASNHQQPGTILHANSKSIDVATSNGILKLLTLQLSGGKILSVKDILNSRAALFSPGKKFSREAN